MGEISDHGEAVSDMEASSVAPLSGTREICGEEKREEAEVMPSWHTIFFSAGVEGHNSPLHLFGKGKIQTKVFTSHNIF